MAILTEAGRVALAENLKLPIYMAWGAGRKWMIETQCKRDVTNSDRFRAYSWCS